MLVKKGVMTDQEWDAAQMSRFVDDKRPTSIWACPDPADRAALDAFFGTYHEEAP